MLPNDVARCIGATVGNTYQLRLECLNCRRRTAPRAEVTVWRDPPKEHPCPHRISPLWDSEPLVIFTDKAVHLVDVEPTDWPFPEPKAKLGWWERFKFWLIGYEAP